MKAQTDPSDTEHSYRKDTTTVSVLSRDRNRPGRLLKASVSKATSPQWRGFFTFTPTISVSRIVPSNSAVFGHIRMGCLDGLIRLFDGGLASMWDRDELGASLLHVREDLWMITQLIVNRYAQYACRHSQPDICAFLIARGADIDDEATVSHVENYSGSRVPR